MLVGREGELRELLGAAAVAVSGGRGWTALVGGDAGIGKTRFAAEVADRLRADGVAVAWAACRRDGGAPPYWPWAQLLSRLGHAEVLTSSDSVEPDLARFLLFEAVSEVLRGPRSCWYSTTCTGPTVPRCGCSMPSPRTSA